MESLSLHILCALRLYDRVALPGVGFFHIQYRSAHYDKDNSTFLPPIYELTFEEDNAAQDNYLLKSYIRKNQYSRKEASEALREAVEKLLNELDNQGEVSLEGIGKFSFNEGVITFAADLAFNQLLPILKTRQQDIEEKEDDSSREEILVPYSEEEEEEQDSVDHIPADYHYHKPDYYYIPIHRGFANIAACLLLVVIVALAAILPVGTTNQAATASIIPLTESTALQKPKQDLSAKLISESKAAIAEDTKMENTISVTDKDTVPGASSLSTKPYLNEKADTLPKFYAVVAAFKSEREAHKFIEMQKGNPARYEIIKKSTNYLITVSSATEKQDLQQELPLIRSTYPDAWIYEIPS